MPGCGEGRTSLRTPGDPLSDAAPLRDRTLDRTRCREPGSRHQPGINLLRNLPREERAQSRALAASVTRGAGLGLAKPAATTGAGL